MHHISTKEGKPLVHTAETQADADIYVIIWAWKGEKDISELSKIQKKQKNKNHTKSVSVKKICKYYLGCV